MKTPDWDIRLSRPSFSPDVHNWIEGILSSGWLTKGEYRERFEAALARQCGSAFAVTFNSGTSALVAALQALTIGPGDTVAVPDYSFVATANAVEAVGAKPLFIDVDEDDFGLSPEALKTLSDKSLKAVIVVHQFGIPAKMDAIVTWAGQNNLLVIEDAACAIGSTCTGRQCGAIGDAGILSFHPRKVVTTGEGGALLTGRKQIATTARAHSDHGFGPDGQQLGIGGNLRLPEIACAMGLDQLRRLDEILAKRKKVAEQYQEGLSGNPLWSLPRSPSECTWNYQTFAIRCQSPAARNEIMERLASRRIESVQPASSISALPYYRTKYAVPDSQVVVSRRLTSCVLAIPCHEELSEAEVDQIVSTIRS